MWHEKQLCILQWAYSILCMHVVLLDRMTTISQSLVLSNINILWQFFKYINLPNFTLLDKIHYEIPDMMLGSLVNVYPQLHLMLFINFSPVFVCVHNSFSNVDQALRWHPLGICFCSSAVLIKSRNIILKL